jgi:hypothetical protein
MTPMSARAEACQLAKEMAEKRGGKPSDYMGEAWRIVKERTEVPEYREVDDRDDDPVGRLIGKVARAGWGAAKNTAKSQTNHWNMFKAPTDRPSVIKEQFGFKRTDPIPKLPPKVAEEVKRIFKFW